MTVTSDPVCEDTIEAVDKRYSYIDVAKGLGMLFIVFGHMMKSGMLRQFVFAFHVPLFFILSGLTFTYVYKKNGFFKFTRKKFRRLMIPYYIASVISIAVFEAVSMLGFEIGGGTSLADLDIKSLVIGIIYGNSRLSIFGNMKWNQPLWFLPCMFATLLIVYLIEKVISKYKNINTIRLVIVLLSIFITFFLDMIANGTKGLPLGLEVAVFMVCFVETGIILQSLINPLLKNGKVPHKRYVVYLGVIIACIVVTAVLSVINDFAQVRNYDFGNSFFLFVISAFLGSIATIMISMKINKCYFLEMIGRNSLFILLFHKFPILFFQSVLPVTERILAEENGNSIASNLVGIVLTLITVVLLIIAQKVLLWIKNLILCGVRKNV